MNKLMAGFLAVWISFGFPDLAEAASGEQGYELMFREGTLDELPRDSVLVYERTVGNTLNPDAAARDTGDIELSFTYGDSADAQLRFLKDGKHRVLGTFPASVGNPMIMLFMESVARDMAETAGGSPFYIRNRLKEALINPVEIEAGQFALADGNVGVQTVTLLPFAGDPNADRMRGFGALELRVTVSDAVPGWYASLVAEVPGSAGETIYSSEIVLSGQEETSQ